LRDKSDAMLARTGARPKVFVAAVGKVSDFTSRATFARNFYEAGGIEAVNGEGASSLSELIAEFESSGAKFACLCSSDQVYALEAEAAAKALTDSGAVVHLAGRPGDNEARWRQAGVKAFIFVGCDALATLREAHDILAAK
jgi:methylmalonyl-CoA mutase